MTKTEWIQHLAILITAIATLIGTIASGRKIKEVHLSLNSRLDQFMKVVRASARQDGIHEERERKRKEDSGIDYPPR